MPKSRSLWRRAAVTGLLAILAVTFLAPVGAQAQSAQFTISAGAGPAGSLIFASAVDPCPATPPGLQQVVDFFFTDSAAVTTGMGGALTRPDGTWGPGLSLQVPYHRLIGLSPVVWDEDAPVGPGSFTARCYVFQSGAVVVTREYAPVLFSVTRSSLRFHVTNSTVELGETVRIVPTDPCLPTATQGIAVVQNWTGDYANAPLSMSANGAWDPVSIPIPASFRGGNYQVSITCYTLPEIYTQFGNVLLNVHRPYHYVSLGDSYSSGEGNPSYDLSNPCHRTSNGWPSLLAASESAIETSRHLACSGAKASDALTTRYKGQPAQISAAGAQQPNLVTITIGGNDVGFGSVLRDCFLFDCAGSIGGAKLKIAEFPAASYYQQLKAALPSWSRVVVVGYPRLFPVTHDVTTGCGWLESAEREGLNEAAEYLDQKLAAAAATAGVEYVSTLDVLDGHELCRTDSWIYPIRPNSSAAGHPDGSGLQAMAAKVNSVISIP